jgi:hypothetical protein
MPESESNNLEICLTSYSWELFSDYGDILFCSNDKIIYIMSTNLKLNCAFRQHIKVNEIYYSNKFGTICKNQFNKCTRLFSIESISHQICPMCKIAPLPPFQK